VLSPQQRILVPTVTRSVLSGQSPVFGSADWVRSALEMQIVCGATMAQV
jgi:hypothetical protein